MNGVEGLHIETQLKWKKVGENERKIWGWGEE